MGNMKKYNDLFIGGCGLTEKTAQYLENVTAKPTIGYKVDKAGNKRVYVSHRGMVYTAGGRSYVRIFTRYIGLANGAKTVTAITFQAMVIMGVFAHNRSALAWLKERDTRLGLKSPVAS